MAPEPARVERRHHSHVKLWAIYSDAHAEIDVYGDRDGLRALPAAASQGNRLELPLDEPPVGWNELGRTVRVIRVDPNQTGDPRICFRRDGSVFVLSGSNRELSRIVGSSTSELADGPEKQNGVGSHLHLDPTSDPERQFYCPDSGSVVVGFDSDEAR
jgi:hypothetical protein